VLGDKSMLTNIRDDQVAPILKEGGLPHLFDLMRKRAAELRAKK
jgi:phospholipid transport system substrate-binding protein